MEDYVTFEQAVKLKELGFDWMCNHYYDIETKEFIENHNDYSPEDSFNDCSSYDDHNGCWNCVSAPTLAQAQKWLREVKSIHIEIKYTPNLQYEPWLGKVVIIENYPKPNTIIDTDTCDTYEQALSAGIDKALELLK